MLLHVSKTHESTSYEVTAAGVGLAEVANLSLSASDGSWEEPLAIDDASDSLITAHASLAAVVPPCFVQATADSGMISTYSLPGEYEPLVSLEEYQGGGSCQLTYRETVNDVPTRIQPKDFAFVPGGWTPEGNYVFHFFYIRQDTLIKLQQGNDATEKTIGHAVSNNLISWHFVDTGRDTAAIRTRGGKFDSLHVWAPHVVRHGITYYMFYTGVDQNHDQRMGLATSTDLFHWTQQDDPIIDFTSLGSWATPQTAAFGNAAQFRDPFVMEDPDNPGDWLMYFVTVSGALDESHSVVGYIRSRGGDFTDWFGDAPIYATYVDTVNAESPHAFERQGKWWLLYTRSGADNPEVFALSNPTSVTDTTSANWTTQGSINDLIVDEYTTVPSNAYTYWKATELLTLNAARGLTFLAGFNDQAIGISYIQVHDRSSPYLFEEHCPVDATGVGEGPPTIGAVRLALVSPVARAPFEFAIDLPERGEVELGIFDLAGRRVATVMRGFALAGRTKAIWDGRGRSGERIRSGMYFACLRSGGLSKSVSVPLLR